MVKGGPCRLARPLHDVKLPVRPTLERRSVQPDLLATPPKTLLAFLLPVGKPVLPEHRPNLLGRLSRERIACEESKDVRLGREKSPLDLKDKGVVAPGTQRSEPQVPVKTGLVGRVDSWRRVQILRLVAERIGCPGLAVAR